MTSIRKFWWAGLGLALFVGCAEEQSTTAPGSAPAVDTGPAPTTPPGGAPAATPGAPAAPSTPESKDADKGDAGKKDAEKSDNAPAALPKVEGPKIDAPKPDADKSDGDKKSDATKLSDDQLAEIKKLPADDQVKAIKQIVCPVSGENLGDMGVPLKVTAEGKSFFICCKGCKKEVDANAKAVLAKLKD